jgi:DICT domain-containing protein
MSSEYSLFEWVMGQAAAVAVPLRSLTLSDATLGASAQRFVESGRGLLHWCQRNELLVLDHHAKDACVYAGFERFSRMRPALSRYRQLCDAACGLTIFGYPDTPLLLEALKVAISQDHPLASEWFLVVKASRYSALIVARDLDGFGQSDPLTTRRLTGIALHDEQVINAACERLSAEATRLATESPWGATVPFVA